jgi:hypothetical protein
MKEPYVESICNHGGGDTTHIAYWLLDCLDRRPIFHEGQLTFYLAYHSQDRSHFASTQRSDELAQAVVESCKRETSLNGLGFGEIRFAIETASRPNHISLRLCDGKGQILSERSPLLIEFQWVENDLWIRPGTLSLVRRRTLQLSRSTRLVASLIVEGVEIAPHVDRWQQDVRSLKPLVYFPEGRTTLLVGNMPGCDLSTAIMTTPLNITYDSKEDQWTWFVPDNTNLLNGTSKSPMNLEYADQGSGQTLSLRGERISLATLRELKAANRPPQFRLNIIGCVLPRPHPDGYGRIPDDAPPILNSVARTAVRLPNDNWIYFHEREQATYFLSRKRDLPGRQLTNGMSATFGSPNGADNPLKGVWTENRGTLPLAFIGELRLFQPFVTVLAFGPILEKVPHDLFPEYSDSMLGRAQVQLRSFDGQHFALLFRESAIHPVYLVEPTSSRRSLRFDPQQQRIIDLKSRAEFILGATHYSLSSSTNSAYAAAQDPETTGGGS